MKNINNDPYKIKNYKEKKSLENQRLDRLENSLIDIVKELKRVGDLLENIQNNK